MNIRSNDHDPLFPHRILERGVEPAMRERILAILAPYINKLHLAEMRLEMQQKLHQEFGIRVIIQDPMEVIDRAPTVQNIFTIQEVKTSNGACQDRADEKKKSIIPIPGYRRRKWE